MPACDGACEPDEDGALSDARVFTASLARARAVAAADAGAAELCVARRSLWWEVGAWMSMMCAPTLLTTVVSAVACGLSCGLGCLVLLASAPYWAAHHRERVSFAAVVTTRRLVTSEEVGVDLFAHPGAVRTIAQGFRDYAAAKVSEGCCEGTGEVHIFIKDPETGQRRMVSGCCGVERNAPPDRVISCVEDARGLADAIERARLTGAYDEAAAASSRRRVAGAAEQARRLAGRWEAVLDARTGAHFYVDRESGETSWELPDEVRAAIAVAAAAARRTAPAHPHPLVRAEPRKGAFCDLCGTQGDGGRFNTCLACNYDECDACHAQPAAAATGAPK